VRAMSDDGASDEHGIEDDWEFYPCQVDGAPASILINLRFMYEDPRDENDHVYHALLKLRELGPEGMGTQSEMERLSPIEDAIFDRADRAGAQPVGRVRTQGAWRLSVYGPKDLPWASWLKELAGPDAELQVDADPDFDYVNDFLLPDPERHQWIQDRRVCEQLLSHGDEPNLVRPVSHFIDYDGAPPAALIDALKSLGFEINDLGTSLECTKLHDTQLEGLHDLVMTLVTLADEHDAAYDGWGAPATKASDVTN
jgi:regulator of RNase E activity RraB